MCKGCTGMPTVPQKWLSRRAYEEHIKKYNSAHKAASRACRDAAKQRAAAFEAQLARPLQGSGPLGQFSVHDVLAIEFALHIEQHLSPEQLAKPIAAIDNAAVQIFSKWLNGSRTVGVGGIFARPADARFPGESAVPSFFLLSLQARKQRKDADALVAFYTAQERLKHHSNRDVAALSPTATLTDVLRAVQRKAGRPSSLTPASPAGGSPQLRQNWAGGGFTPDAIVMRSSMDTRRIGISLKETQEDVLRASRLVFHGMPKSIRDLRNLKPSRRKLQVAHATTARLHREQLNMYHAQEAAKRVSKICISWDEGTGGSFADGKTAVLCGATGNIDEDARLTYKDMLGMRVLSAKTGRSVANALVSICDSRGISTIEGGGVKGGYFVLTDAVSSNIGHSKGAIAYLREHFKSPLLFPIRCEAHITARAWAHAMKFGGRSSKRQSIKRRGGGAERSGESNKTKEVMLIEDVGCILAKMPQVREACQALQSETLRRVSGNVDTRWQYTAEGLRSTIGASIVLERFIEVWAQAMEQHGVKVDREGMSPHDLYHKAFETKVPASVLKAVVEKDAWMKKDVFNEWF